MEKFEFSAIYQPTTLFSLKTSNSTNSGAKSLFLPSPYSIKMSILNQAITFGGDLETLERKDSEIFNIIRDTQIAFNINGNFCVNNLFVKILKAARDGAGFTETVSFREYLYLSEEVEIIFKVKNKEDADYLKKYLHKINYFGKRGCFFQFLNYSDNPKEPNVRLFDTKTVVFGLLQEYDDFPINATFDKVNNHSSTNVKRERKIYVLPLKKGKSSKSFTNYKVI